MNKVVKFSKRMLIVLWFFAFVASCEKAEDQIKEETVKDADGNVYKTVKIGDQVWMAENLRTTKYNDGTPILNVTYDDEWGKLYTGAFCNYDNMEGNAVIYGRLYNWDVVKTGKLAPVGWHVPTDQDWTSLENYLVDNGYDFDENSNGYKIAKSLSSKAEWLSCYKDGTPGKDPENNNSTGFTALPSGSRDYYYGDFGYIGKHCYWWTSTEFRGNDIYVRRMNYCDESLDRVYSNKRNGYSIRLVKD